MPKEFCITEHALYESHVCGSGNASGVRLFRLPANRKAHGHLSEIQWSELRQGDVVLAIITSKTTNGLEALDVLQFWRVEEWLGDDFFRVMVNNLIGMGGDGDYIHDRLAGLV